MFYAQWSRRDVRPRDPATHRLRVDARAIAPPEPREDDATNADGCRFRDSFKYTEGTSFKVGDCVMVQLEGEGVREGESLRHAAAQILQIWWPAPEEDEDEDEPWAEVRWLYCAEEIVPAKRRPAPASKYPDREVFETTHVDEVPASSLMGCIEVLSYDAYVQRRQQEDRKAMKDVFFCRYVWEPGAQLTECGPAAERCRRAQALCRKGRGVKRRGAAWDGDVVSDEERIPEDHATRGPRDRLRRASNALQLSAAPKRLPCRENERDTIENFVLEMLSAPGGDGANKAQAENDESRDDKQKIAQRVFVKIGDRRGDQVAVLEGVSAGDEVVTSGQLKLRNGSPLNINNEVTPANERAPNPVNK